MRVVVLLLAGVLPALAQDINFTNRVVTFTNLEGRAFIKVQLVKADMDGVIWRSDSEGAGRVCYTNLNLGFLMSVGVPTNRVAIAKSRAERAHAYNTRLANRSSQTEAEAHYQAMVLTGLRPDDLAQSQTYLKEGRLIQALPEHCALVDAALNDATLDYRGLDWLNTHRIMLMGYGGSEIDGSTFKVAGGYIYAVGTYRYTTVTGASSVIARYTTSREQAEAYFLWRRGNGPRPNWVSSE